MCIPVRDYLGDYVDKTLLIQACNLVEQSVEFLDFDDKKERVCQYGLKVVCFFFLFVWFFVCLFVCLFFVCLLFFFNDYKTCYLGSNVFIYNILYLNVFISYEICPDKLKSITPLFCLIF